MFLAWPSTPKMRIDYLRAARLCTDSEMELVNDARRENLPRWTPSQLKTKRKQAKNLRGKWIAQARKQQRQAQKKRGDRMSDIPWRSRAKAELFEEVLRRFDKQAKRITSQGGA